MPFAVLTPKVLLLSVWPLPRSLATTGGISVDFFSSSYLDVSVQTVPFIYLCIQYMMTGLLPAGFPHSDICGSLTASVSPQLIAGCCVLLRLLMPRHSPYALCSLTISIYEISFWFWLFPRRIFFVVFVTLTIKKFFHVFYHIILALFSFQGTISGRLSPAFFLLLSQMVGSSGLEPPTSRLSGVRSNHLSYEPNFSGALPVVEMNRIELSTPCLQGRCSPS